MNGEYESWVPDQEDEDPILEFAQRVEESEIRDMLTFH